MRNLLSWERAEDLVDKDAILRRVKINSFELNRVRFVELPPFWRQTRVVNIRKSIVSNLPMKISGKRLAIWVVSVKIERCALGSCRRNGFVALDITACHNVFTVEGFVADCKPQFRVATVLESQPVLSRQSPAFDFVYSRLMVAEGV